ncbi:hypothetical protein SeLEV6574_g08074 [Synchytrium endobioticum]|uniref:SigF-like NTF2-like domain-containing protein n=1 Tax=Synchytrium endobioticum TaxID=286115 RepID=A0A507C5V0_9FUNG|nr:hypothetical protein SeLEV6574_g08074 [Synchytrium endobioticum]
MGDQHTDDVKPYEVDNNVDKKMSWEKTLHNIVYGIVTTDIDAIRHTLEKHYTADMILYHPYFIAYGREQAFQIFEMWSGSNMTLHPKVHHIGINEEKGEALVEFSQFANQKLVGGLLPMRIRLVALVKWREEDGERKIYYHRDILETSSILKYTPILGPIYTKIIRPRATYFWCWAYQTMKKLGIYSLVPSMAKDMAAFLQYTCLAPTLPIIHTKEGSRRPRTRQSHRDFCPAIS